MVASLVFPKRQDFFIPSRLMVLSFSVMILGGSTLLFLDSASVHGRIASFQESLFMATSAVCVTGLAVCDTGSDYSHFGQMVILLLIQMGGLGILTFSNLIVLLKRKRADMGQRMLIEESHGMLPTISPKSLVMSVFVYTGIIELCGTLVLSLRFYGAYGYSWSQAVWTGLFHSISAFCNAGFSLFSNSLVDFSNDWIINWTIMILIILGGIGFVVLADLKSRYLAWKKGKRGRLTLHSKFVLFMTTLLTIVGFLLFLVLELTGKAMPHSVSSHILESFFLSVTARTAGFNTVDMSQLTNASLLILMFLMFIGGSPGSTAGGIKTTSFGTLWVLLSSRSRNRPDAEIMGRRLPNETVAKALITIIGFSIITGLAVIALQVTELFGVPHAEYRGKFLEYLFEVISALCTVGLSTGITTTLSGMGRTIIIICMFIGRLGPVLLASSVIGTKKRLAFTYPEEDILVG